MKVYGFLASGFLTFVGAYQGLASDTLLDKLKALRERTSSESEDILKLSTQIKSLNEQLSQAASRIIQEDFSPESQREYERIKAETAIKTDELFRHYRDDHHISHHDFKSFSSEKVEDLPQEHILDLSGDKKKELNKDYQQVTTLYMRDGRDYSNSYSLSSTFPNLKTLDISNNEYIWSSDIQSLQTLETLIIRGKTRLSLFDFTYDFKSLKTLDVTDNPKFTLREIEHLKQSRPHLNVIYR